MPPRRAGADDATAHGGPPGAGAAAGAPQPGFRYLDTAGAPLTDPAQLERVRAPAIPPA
ncbi:hypothetical protein ACQPZG_05245 (plasmid) [Streptomyces sp. CA-294286]|uniref:hypothetical protein n=1 Tax=Streptomyces sp. CA-294286 TaxID=3240070 RepID=UPI003D92A5BC